MLTRLPKYSMKFFSYIVNPIDCPNFVWPIHANTSSSSLFWNDDMVATFCERSIQQITKEFLKKEFSHCIFLDKTVDFLVKLVRIQIF